jgi:hypothetical protein
LRREEQRFLTFGQQECDEGMQEGSVDNGRAGAPDG